MEAANGTTRFQFISRLIYSVFIVITVFLLLHLIFFFRSKAFYISEFIDYSDMWSYEYGSLVDFDELKAEDHFTIHKRTNGELINNKDLCFYTKNIYFTVYMNDTVIYDFHPDTPTIFGKAYGIFPHSVALPVLYSDGDLYIEIENIYPDNKGFLRDIRLENGSDFILSEIRSSARKFAFCVLGFVFGFVLLAIGTVGRHFGPKRFEIISMSTFAILSSLWISTETSIFPILLGSPHVVHFTDYITLDLLALPAMLFVASSTGNQKSKLISVGTVTTLAILLFSIISTATGHQDYHQLLWLSHGNLSLVALICIYLLIYSLVKKKITKKLTYVLVVSTVFCMATGIYDIVRYVITPIKYSSTSYFKYSILFFIVFVGIYEFIMISEMSQKGQYAEIMEKLAYNDGLTGLFNRKAYNKDLEKTKETESLYTFIMLDMNYLKKVNDELGHMIGDTYIKTIADYLSDAFKKNATCYRIGGDEYFVLARYSMNSSAYKNSIDYLLSKIDEFNKQNTYDIPLSVAYGAIEYDPKKDNVENRLKQSDEKMYTMKAEMKAMRQI